MKRGRRGRDEEEENEGAIGNKGDADELGMRRLRRRAVWPPIQPAKMHRQRWRGIEMTIGTWIIVNRG